MAKEWYVVNTYSGHETNVKEKLEAKIVSMNMEDIIFRVVVPETKEIEIKNGTQKEKLKKMFPGYILVEMDMTDEAWFAVRNTPGVTGFIGSSGKGAKPTPLYPHEVDKVLNTMGLSRIELANELKEGDKVKIIEGPFTNMLGKVKFVDVEKNKIEVIIDLFGKETEVEASLVQIERQ